VRPHGRRSKTDMACISRVGLGIWGLHPTYGLLWGLASPAAGIADRAAASNTDSDSLLAF